MSLIGVRGRIFTLDPERPFIKDGIVVFDVKKGVIEDVTSYEKGLEYGLEKFLDLVEALLYLD
jgi:hypothetical protein